MKKSNLTAGILTIALLMGSVPATATEGVTAKLSPQKIYVDGQRVEMLAYSIDDYNRVRIRDLGRAINASVFYDANTDSVRIDRKYGYVGSNETLPTPGDNPIAIPSAQEVFVSGRSVNIEMHNIADNNYAKLRDLGGALNLGMAYDPAADAVYIDTQTAYLPNCPPELLRPEAIPKDVQTDEPAATPQPTALPSGEDSPEVAFAKRNLPEEYAAVKPFLDQIAMMGTNAEKVNAIVRYVCERMTYGDDYDPTIYERIEVIDGITSRSMRYAMFLDPPPVKGLCNHYAKAVDLLCDLTGIPEILIISYGSDHAWNAVYADGWFYVDSTNDDVGDDPIPAEKNLLFAMDTPNLPFKDDNPSATKERMELLVPGSTK